MRGRLDELDGVRAVAILWVALFHHAVFWTPAGEGLDLLPYGDRLAWIPLADVGLFGVLMFFVVSGAVISMSLERFDGPLRFGRARAVRLVPAMLVCSAITFVLTALLGPPELTRSVPEWLISAAFVPPGHVGRVLGVEGWEWLDGAYWSLWVEVRFYVVAALLAYGLRGAFLPAWLLFAAGCASLHIAGMMEIGQASALSRLLFAEYQPYFTAGIALAALRGGGGRLALAALSASAVLALGYLAFGGMGEAAWSGSSVVALGIAFALPGLAMLRPSAVRVLAARPLTALGRASYGYYLLHQNAGIALVLALPLVGWASVGWMLVVQAGLIGMALALFAWVERPVAARAGKHRPERAAPVL